MRLLDQPARALEADRRARVGVAKPAQLAILVRGTGALEAHREVESAHLFARPITRLLARLRSLVYILTHDTTGVDARAAFIPTLLVAWLGAAVVASRSPSDRS